MFVVLSTVEGNTGEEKIKHRAYFTDPGYTFEYSQHFAFDPFTPFPELSKYTSGPATTAPGPTTPTPEPYTPAPAPEPTTSAPGSTTLAPQSNSAAPESSAVILKAKKNKIIRKKKARKTTCGNTGMGQSKESNESF